MTMFRPISSWTLHSKQISNENTKMHISNLNMVSLPKQLKIFIGPLHAYWSVVYGVFTQYGPQHVQFDIFRAPIRSVGAVPHRPTLTTAHTHTPTPTPTYIQSRLLRQCTKKKSKIFPFAKWHFSDGEHMHFRSTASTALLNSLLTLRFRRPFEPAFFCRRTRNHTETSPCAHLTDCQNDAVHCGLLLNTVINVSHCTPSCLPLRLPNAVALPAVPQLARPNVKTIHHLRRHFSL
jgi:hypothetical protein